jgi:hypothetical protein
VTLRAVVYARFSSDKQRYRSIEDQVALCRDFCQRDGLSLVEVYEDRAISGASTANRLGWQRLMRLPLDRPLFGWGGSSKDLQPHRIRGRRKSRELSCVLRARDNVTAAA